MGLVFSEERVFDKKVTSFCDHNFKNMNTMEMNKNKHEFKLAHFR